MGLFTSILGKKEQPKKSPAVKKQLPPLPKASTPTPGAVAKNLETSYNRVLDRNATSAPSHNARSSLTTPLEIQRRVMSIPEVDMQSPEMEIYNAWVVEWAQNIISMEEIVPKNSTFPINVHSKKGGIFYLEPLGIYFFPAHVFKFADPKKFPQGPGFFIDASHCLNAMEVSNFISSKVRLNDGSIFYVPESSDAFRRHKRGL